MKLSKVLDKYYVLSQSAMDIVGFFVDEEPELGEVINIEWNDHSREAFQDQDIDMSQNRNGQFIVTDVDGKNHIFTALDGVDWGVHGVLGT
ncbi:MAG: hypothetical protein ACOH2T_19040 [Pseudomonas sp.]